MSYSAGYRGFTQVIQPYKGSSIYILAGFLLPISARFELGLSVLGHPFHRDLLGFPIYREDTT